MPTLKIIRAYVDLTRPQNATASALAYSIGYLIHALDFHSYYLVGLVIVLLLHSAATVQNDIEDYQIDKANQRRSGLQSQLISLPAARQIVLGLVVAALAVGLLSGPRLLNMVFIAAFLLFTWLYNSPPFRISRRPISSIILLGICYSALPLAYGYLIPRAQLRFIFLAFFIVWFVQRFSISILKDYKDARGDKIYKKRTFYLKYGPLATNRISLVFGTAAYIGACILLVHFNNHRAFYYIALGLSIILAARNAIFRLALLRTQDEKILATIFRGTFFYQNQFEAAVLLCLILS